MINVADSDSPPLSDTRSGLFVFVQRNHQRIHAQRTRRSSGDRAFQGKSRTGRKHVGDRATLDAQGDFDRQSRPKSSAD